MYNLICIITKYNKINSKYKSSLLVLPKAWKKDIMFQNYRKAQL